MVSGFFKHLFFFFCIFHLSFLLSIADPETNKQKNRLNGGLTEKIQFWILTVVLSVVGSRVASLVVLEFSLRAISARITGGSVRTKFIVTFHTFLHDNS